MYNLPNFLSYKPPGMGCPRGSNIKGVIICITHIFLISSVVNKEKITLSGAKCMSVLPIMTKCRSKYKNMLNYFDFFLKINSFGSISDLNWVNNTDILT